MPLKTAQTHKSVDNSNALLTKGFGQQNPNRGNIANSQ
jgi:hypothetical protein